MEDEHSLRPTVHDGDCECPDCDSAEERAIEMTINQATREHEECERTAARIAALEAQLADLRAVHGKVTDRLINLADHVCGVAPTAPPLVSIARLEARLMPA